MSEKEPNNLLFMHGGQILLFLTINVNQHNRIALYICLGVGMKFKLRFSGDGANDVGMFRTQEADIGVGISGAEGMQIKDVFS